MLRESAERGERANRGGTGANQHEQTSQRATSAEPTLSDLGLTRDQSSRYQRLAAMPEEHFEAAVEAAKAADGSGGHPGVGDALCAILVSWRGIGAAKLKGYFAEQARARMVEGGRKGGKGPKNSSDPIRDKGDSRDKAAAQFGVSGAAVDQAERVLKKAIPEVRRAVDQVDGRVRAREADPGRVCRNLQTLCRRVRAREADPVRRSPRDP